MSQQKPSVGRIVHFTRAPGSEPVPAIIVKVWSDTCVNLREFPDDDSGYCPRWTSVVQRDASNEEHGNYWEWPPRG